MSLFEFDTDKESANLAKHKLTFEAAPLIFEGAYIEEEDARYNYKESRFVATGPIAEFGGRIHVVVYTWRGLARRIISFRKANEREIGKYQTHLD